MLTQLTRTRARLLPVNIITLADGVESDKTINFCDPADRKWFMNHCYWAMNNGHKVGMEPK